MSFKLGNLVRQTSPITYGCLEDSTLVVVGITKDEPFPFKAVVASGSGEVWLFTHQELELIQ